MIIADTIRQEVMPDMVYSLCKLSQKHIKKTELQRLITLDATDSSSKDQFSYVYRFAIACDFIRESGDGTVEPNFSEEELSSFRRFRYAIFSHVFHDGDTNFTQVAKWYMACDIPQNPQKGSTVLSINTSSEFLQNKPESLDVTDNFFNGFRFWMTALGLTAFYAQASYTLLFSAHRIIKDWLEFSKPFEAGSNIPARTFFEKLVKDCPVFSGCIKGNNVGASLSMALRVLNNCDVIGLIRITDAGDVWHLTKSVNYKSSNDITDIVIKEVRDE